MKEILDLFCTKDEFRPLFVKPWLLHEDTVCATDGHGMVIIKDSELASRYEYKGGQPDITKVIPEINRQDVITIKQLEDAFAKCPLVDEMIEKDYGKCSKCDGEGHCTYCDAECEVCGGTGRNVSIIETGKQIIDELSKFQVNGILFMQAQMQRLYYSMKLLKIDSIAHLSGFELKPNLMRHENYTFVIMPCTES